MSDSNFRIDTKLGNPNGVQRIYLVETENLQVESIMEEGATQERAVEICTEISFSLCLNSHLCTCKVKLQRLYNNNKKGIQGTTTME